MMKGSELIVNATQDERDGFMSMVHGAVVLLIVLTDKVESNTSER